MLENLYFWKNKSNPLSIALIIGAVLIIIALGGAGGWYYFVKIPADQRVAEAEQAVAEKKKNITTIKDFYTKSLSGASIDKTIEVLSEIHKSLVPIRSVLNMDWMSYRCDTKKCSVQFKFNNGEILTQPELVFGGKSYKPMVPIMKKGQRNKAKFDLEYANIDSGLNGNKILEAYKANRKGLGLYSCNELMGYINTYNSYIRTKPGSGGKDNPEMLVVKTTPKSTVLDLEKKLSGSVKSYSMLIGAWEMSVNSKSNTVGNEFDELSLQVLLYKQAYKDAFLINKIETQNNGIKVSGGMICKG